MASLNRKRWLSILFFILIMTADWIYIFRIVQQSYIITPLEVLLTFIIPLFLFLTVSSCAGMYFAKKWAYYSAYTLIVASAIFVTISYGGIIHTLVIDIYYLYALLVLNLITIAFLIYYQRSTT